VVNASSGIITTLVGLGNTAGLLITPEAIAFDASGALYISDIGLHTVSKFAGGVLTLNFAGTGAIGFAGDGGPATGAELTDPIGVATDGAQTSYDPRFIKDLIGGRAHEHSALRSFFGITSDVDLGSPRAHRLYVDASPLNYVTRDDPPVFLFYAEPHAPLAPDAKPGQGIHHPLFGRALKAKLDPLCVECILRHRDDYPRQDDPNEDMCRDMTSFFTRHFH